MKKILFRCQMIALLFCLSYATSLYATSKSSHQFSSQDEIEYQYGSHKLNKKNYIKNLDHNVYEYVKHKREHEGWIWYYEEEFKEAYNHFIKHFSDPTKPYNFSADAFGTITDRDGLIKPDADYWYDKKGNRITGAEYRRLTERKKKKYHSFDANGAVVRYFKEIARAIIEKRLKEGNL